MVRSVLLAAALLAAPAAMAQRLSPLNGTRLLTVCTAAADTMGCDAYLSGIADAIAVLGRARAPACIPAAVTGLQLRSVAVKYLRAHPEQAQEKAGHVAIAALHEAFPCEGGL